MWITPNYENYGTHAFDLRIMRSLLKFNQNQITWQDWIYAVPPIYREKAFNGLCIVYTSFLGLEATDETLIVIIHAIYKWIGQNIEPQKFKAIYENRTITKQI